MSVCTACVDRVYREEIELSEQQRVQCRRDLDVLVSELTAALHVNDEKTASPDTLTLKARFNFFTVHSTLWFLPCSGLTLLVGWQEGHPACKDWVLVSWWCHFDWSFARLIAPVVTTTSIILSSSKIQNVAPFQPSLGSGDVEWGTTVCRLVLCPWPRWENLQRSSAWWGGGLLSTVTNCTAVSALRASLTPHNYFWHPSNFVVLNMPRDVT